MCCIIGAFLFNGFGAHCHIAPKSQSFTYLPSSELFGGGLTGSGCFTIPFFCTFRHGLPPISIMETSPNVFTLSTAIVLEDFIFNSQ